MCVWNGMIWSLIFEMQFLTVLNQRLLCICVSFLSLLISQYSWCSVHVLSTVYMCMHMHIQSSSKSIDSFSDIK